MLFAATGDPRLPMELVDKVQSDCCLSTAMFSSSFDCSFSDYNDNIEMSFNKNNINCHMILHYLHKCFIRDGHFPVLIKLRDFSRCLRHTGDSTQISLGVLVSKQESMCEHIVHSKSGCLFCNHRNHGNTPQAKHFPTFSNFTDFSLTTVKFPDFSRFSRLVAAICN